jgi:phosphohistidine phosphatase
MRLLVIRHADAGEADPRRYPDDRDRPLTDRGRLEHRAVATALVRMDLRPTRLYTSPLLRARETAAITSEVLGGPAPELLDALSDHFSMVHVLDVLAQQGDDALVACVGHEPSLSGLAALLLHPQGAVRIAMPKSGVIGLESAGPPRPGSARLLFALPPAAC